MPDLPMLMEALSLPQCAKPLMSKEQPISHWAVSICSKEASAKHLMR